MSGIEIAGIVLGAIPLVISGMEHYANGVSTMGRFRKYRLELKTLINILKTERAKLMNTCEKLLVGIAPPWKIEAMIEDPFSLTWREPQIQKKIETRLWRSKDEFENTIRDVHAAIEEMKGRLGLQQDGKVKWLEGNTLLRELKRATFSLRKSSYDDLLARIKDGIASLNTLTAQNVELEPKRKIRSQGRLLTLVRQISGSIYRAFQSSFLCRDTHDLNLELAPRSADFTPHDDDEQIAKGLSFRIAIASHTNSSASFWNDVVVQKMTASKVLPLIPSPSPGVRTSTKKASGKEKSVGFLWQSSITFTGSTATTASSSASSATSTSATSRLSKISSCTSNASKTTTAVKSPVAATSVSGLKIGLSKGSSSAATAAVAVCLCETLLGARNRPTVSCYGYIVDKRYAKEYKVFPAMATDSCRQPWSTVSLRQALEQHSGMQLSVKLGKSAAFPALTYRDRLYLAATISSSVLQLHETPWLGSSSLTSDNILFIDQKDGTPLYAHAFVAASVPDRQAAAAPAATAAAHMNQPVFNPTLLSLGVLLVELMVGQLLHDGADALAQYAAAQKLLNEVEQQGGINYVSAVRRCLNYHQFRQKVSLEDQECRQDVYNTVVALLEDAYGETCD